MTDYHYDDAHNDWLNDVADLLAPWIVENDVAQEALISDAIERLIAERRDAAATERVRIAARIRDAADLIDEHADGMSSDTAIRYRARAEAFRDAACVAETAPEEGQ